MVFCFKCGEKQPVVEIIIEEDEVPECEELEDDCTDEHTDGHTDEHNDE
jgi:hypothetical protein